MCPVYRPSPRCQSLPSLTPSVSDLQLMQQQALVAQSAYLSPVATVAAVQMQQLAALNPSSIIATPIASITPSSGNLRQRSPGPPGCSRPEYKLKQWRDRNTVIQLNNWLVVCS